MVLPRRHLKEFLSLADPCRKHWPCVMTAHDVNKKLQTGNILLCRRRLHEGVFIRGEGGGGLIEEGHLCFQLKSIRGLLQRGDLKSFNGMNLFLSLENPGYTEGWGNFGSTRCFQA